MSRISLSELLRRSRGNMSAGTHPVVRGSALKMIELAYKEGINVQISEGYRTYARQNSLYAQGRTKPGNIVTNARGGQSWHNHKVAVDFFLTNNSGSKAIWSVNSKWRRAVAIAKSLGFEAGLDWKGFVDPPHLQMTGGLSMADLRAGKKPNIKMKGGVTVPKPSTPSGYSASLKKVQQDLNKLGFSVGKADGYDGILTIAGVKAFQKAYKLTVDGIAGKLTKAKINELLKGGITVSEAKKLQNEINKLNRNIKTLTSNLNKKEDKVNVQTTVSDWAKEDWERAVHGGYFDGTNPRHPLTREQSAKVVNKLVDNLREYDLAELKERITKLEADVEEV